MSEARDELYKSVGCLVTVVTIALAVFLLYHGAEIAERILR